MATILPFRALRYSSNLKKKASSLLAPPYDVISKDLKKQLLGAHPNNAIRLILGNPSVEEHSASAYAGAAKTLRSWRKKGVLGRDGQPSLYVYQQAFKVEGKTYKRTGFLALSRLEPFGRSKGGILAHEFTLAGPKADRLKLMQQAHANFSAIFSLSDMACNCSRVTSPLESAAAATFSESSPLPSSEISIITCPAWCAAFNVMVPRRGFPQASRVLGGSMPWSTELRTM